MVSTRTVDGEGKAGSSRARQRRQSTSKATSDVAERKRVSLAKKKAAKAERERAKAQSERKVAQKKLKKADKKAKAKERQAKREKREHNKTKSTRRKKVRGEGKRSLSSVLSNRRSSRKGFERHPSSRTRKLAIAGVAVLTLAAIGLVAYVHSSAFGVKSVEVSGLSNASRAEVVAASSLVIGQNLLDVDPVVVAAGIAEVPWVHSASVQRRWNGTVKIVVSERMAIAALESPSGYVLVDGEGRQLDITASAPSSQVPVSGAEVSGVIGDDVSAAGLQATNFIASISPAVRPLVTNIDLAEGRLVARLAVDKIEQEFPASRPYLEANFGTNENLDDKMVALETVLTKVDLTCALRIDLSAPSKPALLRTPAATNSENLSTRPIDC